MSVRLVARIIVAGVAALFAMQGLFMLGIGGRSAAALWRLAVGVTVLGALVPRGYRLRVVAGTLCFAGANGLLWVLDHAVRAWLERGTRLRWDHYLVPTIVFLGYLVPFAIWVTRSRRRGAR